MPRAMATQFAAQVLIGAGNMVLQTKKHPGELKDEVCSPGGTTICGIHAMEEGGVRLFIFAHFCSSKKNQIYATLIPIYLTRAIFLKLENFALSCCNRLETLQGRLDERDKGCSCSRYGAGGPDEEIIRIRAEKTFLFFHSVRCISK